MREGSPGHGNCPGRRNVGKWGRGREKEDRMEGGSEEEEKTGRNKGSKKIQK